MIYFLLIFSLLVGVGSMTWSFYGGGYSLIGVMTLGISLLWGLSIWRRWKWFTPIGLALFLFSAAAGVWLQLPFGGMLIGAVCGLLVYDLDAFTTRLRMIESKSSRLERAHLGRLSLLLLLTVIFSSIALRWNSVFNFEWAIFLGIASTWGISLLVRWMMQN